MRWRSGNATVCKTAMRGFESLPHLKFFSFLSRICLMLYNSYKQKSESLVFALRNWIFVWRSDVDTWREDRCLALSDWLPARWDVSSISRASGVFMSTKPRKWFGFLSHSSMFVRIVTQERTRRKPTGFTWRASKAASCASFAFLSGSWGMVINHQILMLWEREELRRIYVFETISPLRGNVTLRATRSSRVEEFLPPFFCSFSLSSWYNVANQKLKYRLLSV